ncbi:MULTISPECIES: caspase, EACC1-associated type [unclassified Saccharothrix]|uniref:caspase, EACC1-associated type n=1 Tax=unclassified Saccharothrix TaxID=2593673 RepID=UPI00307F79EC
MSRLALLVAVSSYEDPTFRQLRAPGADAEALASVLADPDIGGYQVELLHNATAPVVNRSIEALFKQAGFDDQVLLYFSGHGIKDERGELHLAVSDSEADLLGSTAVPARFVRDRVDRSRCRQVLVLLDCCYAGAFPAGSRHRAGDRVDVVGDLGGRGCAVMTSSSALEYSFEPGGDPVGGAARSAFTAALVAGLSTGAADLDGDGLVDVEELYDFVFQRVQSVAPDQTPALKSEVEGTLYVARNPLGGRAGFLGLPPEVVQALRNPLPAVRLAVVDHLVRLSRDPDVRVASPARKALAVLADDADPQVAVAARPATAVGAESAAVLVAVARRTRGLVERQLAVLDEVARAGSDEQWRAAVARVDHYAVRLRRDADNLLVVAGVDTAVGHRPATALADLLDRALREVDGGRVRVEEVAEVVVRGRAVADLTHLVVELLENAITFSPPGAVVLLGARRRDCGVTITVLDRGPGVSALAAERFGRAGTGRVDLDRMGFEVVARLAGRHGLGVAVSTMVDVDSGALATVDVPPELLA